MLPVLPLSAAVGWVIGYLVLWCTLPRQFSLQSTSLWNLSLHRKRKLRLTYTCLKKLAVPSHTKKKKCMNQCPGQPANSLHETGGNAITIYVTLQEKRGTNWDLCCTVSSLFFHCPHFFSFDYFLFLFNLRYIDIQPGAQHQRRGYSPYIASEPTCLLLP